MKADSDVLILGGGCAGLSLARELAGFGARCPSARIIEQRARYENDRTWCFWGDNGALMSHLSDHQWSRALLRARGQVITFDCIKHPYHMISGARFYGDALQKIADVPQIQLEKGVTILSEPRLINGLWQIETDVGVRRGQKLIDTRGHVKSRQQHEAPILWQSFLGHEITCEEPIFDPATVTLMDFADDSSGRIVFTYLLPLSAKRALIEVTVFGKSPVTPAELASPLQQQIRARVGRHAYVVDRSEQGMLPMGLPPEKETTLTNYMRVGLMHGAARASTGYAFQRIQRWARQCAARLVETGSLIGHAADPLLTRKMDRLFLSLLRRQPECAPALFLGMFERSKSDTLVRFLSDRASLGDYLGIISALPALPFIRQIGHSLTRAP